MDLSTLLARMRREAAIMQNIKMRQELDAPVQQAPAVDDAISSSHYDH
jgi:hypothetical protein